MGLFDRFAKAVADEIQKAPSMLPGTVTMTEQEMRNQAQGSAYNPDPLPRNPILPQIPFSPGLPIIPGAINPLTDRGRPDPRRYEFQVAQNINITETRLVPFKVLRAAADQIDILRRCIEVLKAKMNGLDWDITIANNAQEKIISERGGDHLRALAEAREEFAPEIARLRSFWEVPDRSNGLVFADWLNVFLEDHLVIDAVAVWGQKNVGGDLYGFQLIDGSTIKPLLDPRGFRPEPPHPAYQQILYGFPRSEFTATTDDPKADGEFTADELAYLVRNRRTTSVYGLGPVERSLALADIYLRRQQWLRAEYTDGVLPELMFESDATFGGNPELLRAYENVLNDDLSGQTEQRKRARILPAGLKPVQFDGYGEKFKDTLDDYLVTSICGHFGVLPSEIGFTPKSGLGGAGHQEGEALSAENIGLTPMANWVGKMLTQLSYTFLGMPRELEFKFMVENPQTTSDLSKAEDIRIRGGVKTVNESRSDLGMPLLDSPEADLPMIVAGNNVMWLSPDGLITNTNAMADSELTQPQPTDTPAEVAAPTEPAKPEEPVKPEKPALDEVKSFIKWARKPHNRPFEFKFVETTYAETLNKFVDAKDLDGARWYAERYLGL